MPRFTRWLIVIDALVLIAVIVLEFTPAGPIGRWFEGHPYEVLAPLGNGVPYHLVYFTCFCLFPALHLIALMTKERLYITNMHG